MTPFGARLRKLRAQRGLSLKDMAAGLGVSPAYLSALEHGRRGRPNRRTIHRICQYFQIIWDEAEELEALARISHPRVVVDSGGIEPSFVTGSAWPCRPVPAEGEHADLRLQR